MIAIGTRIRFEPAGIEIESKYGTSLLAAAKQAVVPIRMRCGGKAACFTCKVDVVGDECLFTPPSPAEQHKLGIEATQGLRLACQVRITGQEGILTVSVPEDPLKAVVRRKLAKQQEDDVW